MHRCSLCSTLAALGSLGQFFAWFCLHPNPCVCGSTWNRCKDDCKICFPCLDPALRSAAWKQHDVCAKYQVAPKDGSLPKTLQRTEEWYNAELRPSLQTASIFNRPVHLYGPAKLMHLQQSLQLCLGIALVGRNTSEVGSFLQTFSRAAHKLRAGSGVGFVGGAAKVYRRVKLRCFRKAPVLYETQHVQT